jgi:hypothetical protein
MITLIYTTLLKGNMLNEIFFLPSRKIFASTNLLIFLSRDECENLQPCSADQ